MKVGNYVRTKHFGINKIKGFYSDDHYDYIMVDDDLIKKENIIKSSPNIIDLIEVGDYVNYGDIMGGLVLDKKDDEITVLTILPSKLKNKDIRSVITREQIESHLYKLEVD